VTDDDTASGLSELTAANPAAASAITARMDIADTMLFYTSWLEQRVRAARASASTSACTKQCALTTLRLSPAARVFDAPGAQVPGTDGRRCRARALCGRRLRRLHARRHPFDLACAAAGSNRSACAYVQHRTTRHAASFGVRSLSGGRAAGHHGPALRGVHCSMSGDKSYRSAGPLAASYSVC
jgi:hypothetical protein